MDDSNVHSHPGQLCRGTRATKGRNDSVHRLEKKRQKFVSVEQQVSLGIWLLSSFRRQRSRLACSCELQRTLFQTPVTHREQEPGSLSLSHVLGRKEHHWLQWVWLSYFSTSNLLLPRLPCSSLCSCPWNFAHCWRSPGLGLRKSGGGASRQGHRLPVPDWTSYVFARPEQPTCTIVHILALPSSVLNKKKKEGGKQCLRHCAAEAGVSGRHGKRH